MSFVGTSFTVTVNNKMFLEMSVVDFVPLNPLRVFSLRQMCLWAVHDFLIISLLPGTQVYDKLLVFINWVFMQKLFFREVLNFKMQLFVTVSCSCESNARNDKLCV